ncbi:MAG: NADH-quinone oxidoreductase subunit L [Planctomycetes bacterium]|nr:NADH-quinone oxidoreductase subunit L [Planctomycetota bacterium]
MQMPDTILIALLIVALPLAAWTIGFLHAAVRRRLPACQDWISTVAVGVSLALSLYLMFSQVLAGPAGMQAVTHSWRWFAIGSGDNAFVLNFDVLVDNLTVAMFCVVNIVAFLVHVYSRSYMHAEDRYPRFFLHLSLFTFSMLGLLVTSNLMMLFIFWELVGVCSYFLIGFFFLKKSAGDASKKAFVLNRIGDACFMAGIFMIGGLLAKQWPGESVLSFQRIWESIAMLGHGQGPWIGHESEVAIAGLLVFVGCMTKSAQFPLHVWLPDAMEGPTPVSALIHAATMVAAGVYMIVRMFPLMAGKGYVSGDFLDSPALWVIAFIGGITALFSGTIALVQTDLKKGLAYSTCSQLGYMVMAVGVGSISAGMFHLFTHAFFKACLFLGSGSVIHAVHSQEMKDMGGLRAKMPITYATFLIACLAIAGTPLFSGFLSKEAVLGQAAAFGAHHDSLLGWVPFTLAAVTAFLTAFYMFRLLFLTFHGKPGDRHKFEHAHESPAAMTMPLVVLAVLALIAGGIALPFGLDLGTGHWFQDRVNDQVLVQNTMGNTPAFADMQANMVHRHDPLPNANEAVSSFHHHAHTVHMPVLLMSLCAVLIGISAAWLLFVRRRSHDIVGGIPPLAKARVVMSNLYYVDWFYCNRVVPTVKDIADLAKAFDKSVIDALVNGVARFGTHIAWFAGRVDSLVVDGAVNGSGSSMLALGQFFRGLVNGKIQDYVKYTVWGLGLLMIWAVLARG